MIVELLLFQARLSNITICPSRRRHFPKALLRTNARADQDWFAFKDLSSNLTLPWQ